MIPKHKSSEFFGFFAVFEKFAGIFGPALVAVIISATGSTRLSIRSVEQLPEHAIHLGRRHAHLAKVIVRIGPRDFWIAFDEFAHEICLEPQDPAAGELVASIYERVSGTK